MAHTRGRASVSPSRRQQCSQIRGVPTERCVPLSPSPCPSVPPRFVSPRVPSRPRAAPPTPPQMPALISPAAGATRRVPALISGDAFGKAGRLFLCPALSGERLAVLPCRGLLWPQSSGTGGGSAPSCRYTAINASQRCRRQNFPAPPAIPAPVPALQFSAGLGTVMGWEQKAGAPAQLEERLPSPSSTRRERPCAERWDGSPMAAPVVMSARLYPPFPVTPQSGIGVG